MPDATSERPPREQWISLAKAAALFDPPRSRKAMDQLHRRGVLEAWEENGRLYTTEALVREYAAQSPRPARLSSPLGALIESIDRTPSSGDSRADALQALVYELSAENTALRLRVIELERELTAR